MTPESLSPLPGPRVGASQLEDLARHPDAAVRAAVAAHPNTPPEVVGQLAAEFPGEVLGNPALPLLRLAQPGLVQGWPRETVLTLVRHPAAPAWLRAYAQRHPRAEFQEALAVRPDLSHADLHALLGHAAWQVRARLAGRPDLPPDVLEALTVDPDYGVRVTVAARPDLPAAATGALRQDPSLDVRQVLARVGRVAPSQGQE
ncbi:DUF2336 domain-containing protein [Deinococcus aestuarii]|uniref:DUF2336 domain-containing protein n=1 Tax=Deinococcus aestuarii TaxID=2774531 RepID=UPI001FE2B737|nr:DUF2336 domain-containing protein [Deinococcus aestuarii]